ncbi:MAG: peptidylprolyl isomerase [Candidatus Omnitrophica bacterium]|nr:peptidylprolyl isomerase [Candidatus Omnitrophota bacterium]
MEALIDLWKIPKDDAYDILSHAEGDFIVADNYYGPAVFRLLYKREADINEYTNKKKEYYRDLLQKSKKHNEVKEYFEDLLARADYRDYVAEGEKERKIEELKKKSYVVLQTSQGKIGLKLFPEEAPLACENFIGLIEKGFYDGLIFHRVIKDFVIQSGDPTGTGTNGESIWGTPFVNEISESLSFDKPGILAMANSGKDTNKSQFFITVSKQPGLNNRYTIFGEVTYGYDVVEKISKVKTDSNDRPEEEQKIIKAYVERKDKKEAR